MHSLHKRSFGIIMLLIALVAIAPGLSIVAGLLLMIPAFQMIAELPDGSIQPLLWLQPYKPIFGHAFWLRVQLVLPAGTVIRGLPPGAVVDLLPAR